MANQPLHALTNVQEGYTRTRMLAGFIFGSVKDRTRPITETPPQNRKSGVPGMPRVPDGRWDSVPLLDGLSRIHDPKEMHSGPHEAGSQIGRHPALQSKGIPAFIQVYPRLQAVPQHRRRTLARPSRRAGRDCIPVEFEVDNPKPPLLASRRHTCFAPRRKKPMLRSKSFAERIDGFVRSRAVCYV